MHRGIVATTCAWALLAACSQDDSQLIVVVDSDLLVPNELGSVSVRVTDDGSTVSSQFNLQPFSRAADDGARTDVCGRAV